MYKTLKKRKQAYWFISNSNYLARKTLLNLNTQGRGGKSTKSPNMKSPKAGKGKKSTTWDPVLYGGKVNKEEVSIEIFYFQSNQIQIQI